MSYSVLVITVEAGRNTICPPKILIALVEAGSEKYLIYHSVIPNADISRLCRSLADGRDVPVSLVATPGYYGQDGPVIVQACKLHR